VPTHPNDQGFLQGDTKVSPDGELDVAPRAGLGWQITAPTNTTIGLGVDGRLQPATQDDGYREGMVDTIQHSNDTRRESEGSFAYGRFTPGPVAVIPYLRLEQRLFEKLVLAVEYGMPYNSAEFEAGYDRWGKEEEYKTYSWSGFGQRWAGEILWQLDDDVDGDPIAIGIGVAQETYDGDDFSWETLGGWVGVSVGWH